MEILNWPINQELKKEAENHYRTRFAIGLKDKEPLEIIRQITFDGVADNLAIKDIEKLFDFINGDFLNGKIKEIGLEVGAGPGTFSSVLARRPEIEKIYAVEVCQPIVELLMPRVTKYILGDNGNKIVGAVGSFDDIKLPDNSVDFIFDFFSLHHSNNLDITLRECNRILKKDGFILCFDKARPDYFTQTDLNELLDAEYDDNFKKQIGVSKGRKFTRRMNDEKEYRLRDWIQAFKNGGFSKIQYFYLAKTFSGNKISGLIKKTISLLPLSIQLRVNKLLPSAKFSHKFILDSKNRVFSKLVNPFPKEISLLIAYK